MYVGEIIHTQHVFGCGTYYGRALWGREMAQDNMINIIEEMQMVGHKGGLQGNNTEWVFL